MNFVAKLIGGSRLYGLDSPESDIDHRGVFLADGLHDIVGLGVRSKCSSAHTKVEGDDYIYYEFRRFLELCQKTNSAAMEVLFAPDSAFSVLEGPFKAIRRLRHHLIDSAKLQRSSLGYADGEISRAMGTSSRKLGDRRRADIEKYGFSPKNASHCVRICYTTVHFLQTRLYPASLAGYNGDAHSLCYRLKFSPETFTADKVEKELVKAINTLSDTEDRARCQFNEALADTLIAQSYLPIIRTCCK